jgi:hypothetical protein
MHLLKKGAEDRYQATLGLLLDIDELLGRWEAGVNLDTLSFVPGATDYRTRLVLPTYIFGRAHELGVLHTTCETAARKGGGMHVVMLKGSSGTGKSKLLMEARKIACTGGGIFASAKSDQYKRGLPLTAYITILRSLINVYPAGLRFDISKSKLGLRRLSRSGRNE